ncbi:MAG: tRNA glutamyl-Q(34) synthetase GluQRS [Crocinitomicaceae bacterium]|nr:tRNA glutamyl-Q(34) synthetase GluQRS [Crocinitomicaceae bacterium]
MDVRPYIGRFAPSPSGHLHFGSLIAAVASYCDAKSNQGTWLVRIENLDPPREVKGSADDILRTLEGFGLFWDNAVQYQSQRHHLYDSALQKLKASGMTFGCACSRKDLASVGGLDFYPGTCRNGIPHEKEGKSVRFQVSKSNIENIKWNDLVQGNQNVLKSSLGDFILRRSDGYYAYHLAVVVDDADQGVTNIVRGADLMDSSPRHLLLQEALNLGSPLYAHIPLAYNIMKDKLSKLTNASPIQIEDAPNQIQDALKFLGQLDVEIDLPEKMLSQAIDQWDVSKIPKSSRTHWT